MLPWMNPEDMIPHEASQTQKDKHCKIPLMWGPRGVQLVETGSRWWVGVGITVMRAVSVWDANKVLETMLTAAQVYDEIKATELYI